MKNDPFNFQSGMQLVDNNLLDNYYQAGQVYQAMLGPKLQQPSQMPAWSKPGIQFGTQITGNVLGGDVFTQFLGGNQVDKQSPTQAHQIEYNPPMSPYNELSDVEQIPPRSSMLFKAASKVPSFGNIF